MIQTSFWIRAQLTAFWFLSQDTGNPAHPPPCLPPNSTLPLSSLPFGSHLPPASSLGIPGSSSPLKDKLSTPRPTSFFPLVVNLLNNFAWFWILTNIFLYNKTSEIFLSSECSAHGSKQLLKQCQV
ncbi:hypothetical protein CRENBAI_024306 [Crenichthys baileyi]|uniref:Uncharacterized protein n=1 Tax=Crenichthys baileyi TaxID=28760 RepID=A0AAV9S9M6_9TELE